MSVFLIFPWQLLVVVEHLKLQVSLLFAFANLRVKRQRPGRDKPTTITGLTTSVALGHSFSRAAGLD